MRNNKKEENIDKVIEIIEKKNNLKSRDKNYPKKEIKLLRLNPVKSQLSEAQRLRIFKIKSNFFGTDRLMQTYYSFCVTCNKILKKNPLNNVFSDEEINFIMKKINSDINTYNKEHRWIRGKSWESNSSIKEILNRFYSKRLNRSANIDDVKEFLKKKYKGTDKDMEYVFPNTNITFAQFKKNYKTVKNFSKEDKEFRKLWETKVLYSGFLEKINELKQYILKNYSMPKAPQTGKNNNPLHKFINYQFNPKKTLDEFKFEKLKSLKEDLIQRLEHDLNLILELLKKNKIDGEDNFINKLKNQKIKTKLKKDKNIFVKSLKKEEKNLRTLINNIKNWKFKGKK